MQYPPHVPARTESEHASILRLSLLIMARGESWRINRHGEHGERRRLSFPWPLKATRWVRVADVEEGTWEVERALSACAHYVPAPGGGCWIGVPVEEESVVCLWCGYYQASSW